MCQMGFFREDINKKSLLFKKTDNGFKHVLNEYEELKRESEVVLDKLYRIDNNNVELLSVISIIIEKDLEKVLKIVNQLK